MSFNGTEFKEGDAVMVGPEMADFFFAPEFAFKQGRVMEVTEDNGAYPWVADVEVDGFRFAQWIPFDNLTLVKDDPWVD